MTENNEEENEKENNAMEELQNSMVGGLLQGGNMSNLMEMAAPIIEKVSQFDDKLNILLMNQKRLYKKMEEIEQGDDDDKE